jgi:hypothetical protein
VILLLLALVAQQQQSLEGEMRADVDRVPVGGEIVLTIRARSVSADPIQIVLPPLAGLELVARSERSEVSAGAGAGRTTVLELRLRGSMPGKWRIGPAKLRQGRFSLETEPIEIEVTGTTSVPSPSASTLGANIQRLLAQSRPPKSGQQASVSIILSSASAFVGEQVDVVTAAWFPRELRLQLRRPPTVQTPSIDGVYSYPQRSPTGIAASRQVDGRWFDLFVVHQIVFPLTPGQIRVPPATLHYSVPLAFQFFSQEERYAVHSEPAHLEVKQVPAAGAPAAFAGGVGHGLTMERSLTPRSGRAGEPFTMDVVLRGEGNVALWPAPPMVWPSHLRAYTERVSDKIEIVSGKLGGAKTFRYLVIPDSARTAGLPTLVYAYFDPVTRSFAAAKAPAASYLVSPARDVAVSRASPAALMMSPKPAAASRLLNEIPVWLMAGLLLAPPVFVLVRRLPRRRKPDSVDGSRRSDPLARGEAALANALSGLVPHVADLEGERLEAALRALGVDAELARNSVDLRDRIRIARYGPVSEGDRKSLVTELDELVIRLRQVGAADRTRRSLTAVALLLSLMVPPAAAAQGLPPEQLYQQGALSAAATSFAQRTQLEPDVPAHWFNLGATRFRMGESGGALAAWSRAERLAPRDPSIRRALRLVPVPDSRSARALWVPPVTPEELLVLSGILWVAGWLGYAFTRRHRWLVVVIGGVLSAGGAQALAVWYDRPLAIVTRDNAIAVSPHELAPAVAPVQVGSVVSLLQQERGWTMVRESGGKIGWLPLESVEKL